EAALAPGTAGVDSRAGTAVRILPVRYDHGGRRPAEGSTPAHRRTDRRGDDQHLSLRHLPAGQEGDPRRSRRQGNEECDVNERANLTRRSLLKATAAIGGCLVVGIP